MNLKIVKNDRVAGNEAFDLFLRSLPERFCDSGEVIHRGRNVIQIVDSSSLGVGHEKLCVKRYHGLLFFQKWDYTWFRTPKCRKAYENTAELRRRGFPAAEELACVEVWNNGLFQYGFFVSAVGEGERLDSLVIAMQERQETERVERLISQYASLVRRLHEKGVLYWDMNCGNVICRQSGEPGDAQGLADAADAWQFTLIDTNRVRFYPEDQPLGLDTVVGDLILMNPKMGTVELFIAEYLKQRGLYTPEEAARIREIQRQRYERKHTGRKLFRGFWRRMGFRYKAD